MKVSELEGKWLDYWTARALGLPLCEEWDQDDYIMIGTGRGDLETFSPSSEWSDGGPIIERERINVLQWSQPDGMWRAAYGVDFTKAMPGMTYLSAAMRAYVASKFGEEVPDQENP